MNTKIISFIFIILLVGVVTAEEFGYNNLRRGENLNKKTYINYTEISVNNSELLDGLDSTHFVPYTGAIKDVDLGSYDLTAEIVNINTKGGVAYLYMGDSGSYIVDAYGDMYLQSDNDLVLEPDSEQTDVIGDLDVSGGLGIGDTPTANSPIKIDNSIAGGNTINIKNQNTGINAYSGVKAIAENVYLLSIAWGGTSSVSRWGRNVADTMEYLAISGDLAIGTYSTGKDLILGTEQKEAITIDGSNQYVTIHEDLDIYGDYYHDGSQGFTGSCVNVTYSGGIAISCND